MITVPAKGYYMARSVEPEMKAVVAGALDAMVNGLTQPLTPDEAKGGFVVKVTAEETLKFTGETYDEAFQAVNTGFLARHWADGLPIVPPTKEAVQWMLTGTSRSPGEIIAEKVPAKGGKATIEKIAINAVMAGAKPEYLPVIITAMEVITDKGYNTLHLQASASSPTPVIFVNGPIATELGINSGTGYLGYGWQANSTIGRAVRLCLINLGHMWPAENDMGQVGKWAPFGNWTFAENEKDNPWKPYHVDLGFKPEESTVTVSTSNFNRLGPGGAITPQTPYEALMLLSRVLETAEFPNISHAVKGGCDILIGMTPNLAQRLATIGFTKSDVKQWLYDHARISYSDLTEEEIKQLKSNVEGKGLPMQFWVEGGAKNTKGIVPSIPIVNSPDAIRIVVAGGFPGFSFVWKYDFANGHGTKVIRGATLTNAGR